MARPRLYFQKSSPKENGSLMATRLDNGDVARVLINCVRVMNHSTEGVRDFPNLPNSAKRDGFMVQVRVWRCAERLNRK